MINTYNESSLHSTIKKLYALESNGIMECRLDDTPWICDIITENNCVIEIQTSNLSALTEKAEYILNSGRFLKIIHPVAALKWIELYDSSGKLIHRKKSPKKASVYDSLRGMTKICPLFLHTNCSLEVLYCEITEMRRQTEGPSQTLNNARRHLKAWLPMGKKLEKILSKKTFYEKKDWLSLLPEELTKRCEDSSFRVTDLQKAIKEKSGIKNAARASLIVWLLKKMKLIELYETKGRCKWYRVSAF